MGIDLDGGRSGTEVPLLALTTLRKLLHVTLA